MMRKIMKAGIFFFFILFLAVPLIAQDAAPGEDIILTEELGEGVITGEVTSLDADSNAITVKTEDGAERRFSVVSGETILWKGIEDIELSDIEQGEEAEVGYYSDENANLIASWVDVLIKREEPVSLEVEPVPLEKEPELEVKEGSAG